MEGEKDKCGARCFYCGHPVVWSNDFAADECGYGDREYDDGTVQKAEDQIVSFWTCPNCGAEYEILLGAGKPE